MSNVSGRKGKRPRRNLDQSDPAGQPPPRHQRPRVGQHPVLHIHTRHEPGPVVRHQSHVDPARAAADIEHSPARQIHACHQPRNFSLAARREEPFAPDRLEDPDQLRPVKLRALIHRAPPDPQRLQRRPVGRSQNPRRFVHIACPAEEGQERHRPDLRQVRPERVVPDRLVCVLQTIGVPGPKRQPCGPVRGA